MTGSELLTTGDIAKRAGVTRAAVHLWATSGQLVPTTHVGNVRLFTRSDVEQFLAERAARSVGAAS